MDRLRQLIGAHWRVASPDRRRSARESIVSTIYMEGDVFALSHALQCATVHLGIHPTNYTASVLILGATADPASLRECARKLLDLVTEVSK